MSVELLLRWSFVVLLWLLVVQWFAVRYRWGRPPTDRSRRRRLAALRAAAEGWRSGGSGDPVVSWMAHRSLSKAEIVEVLAGHGFGYRGQDRHVDGWPLYFGPGTGTGTGTGTGAAVAARGTAPAAPTVETGESSPAAQLVAELLDAEPDEHGIHVLDPAARPGLSVRAVARAVAMAGWEVVGEDEAPGRLYLHRMPLPDVAPNRAPVTAPPVPERLPRPVRRRFNLSAVLLLVGLTCLFCAALPALTGGDRTVVGILLGLAVAGCVAGVLLFQSGSGAKRRWEEGRRAAAGR